MTEYADRITDPFFKCDICGKGHSITDFILSGVFNGAVFLHSSEEGYYGVLCRSCRKLSLKRTDIGFLNYLKRSILPINADDDPGAKLMRYDSFPYTTLKDTEKDSDYGTIELPETTVESFFEHAFEIFESGPEGSIFLSYSDGDPLVGDRRQVSHIDENRIPKLLDLENKLGTKAFPRYMLFNSSLDQVQRYCYKYYIKFELMKKSSASIDDVSLDRSDNKHKMRFRFMDLLDSARYVDFADHIVTEISSRPIPGLDPFTLSKQLSDAFHDNSAFNSDAEKDNNYWKQKSLEIWDHFKKDSTQELLSRMSNGFAARYIEMSKRSDAFACYNLELQKEYLIKLHEAVTSRRKRSKIVIEISQDESPLVSEAEQKFPNVVIISNDHAINQIKIRISQVAPIDNDSIVFLIRGERGTGKELIAAAIHEASGRPGEFVKVDCGTKLESLFEGKIFGHRRGAYTGADSAEEGAFSIAAGGTVFFDEIGNLKPTMQDILLTPLQDRRFQPVGSSKTIPIDCRIVCATNADLPNMVQSGDFRADLYDRINKFPLQIPPLRNRRQDIPLLVHHFIHKHLAGFTKSSDTGPLSIVNDAIDALMRYDWPGNVRQLENVISGIVLNKVASGKIEDITEKDLPNEVLSIEKSSPQKTPKPKPLPGNTKFTDEDLTYWMKELDGKKTQVAKKLGVSYKTVWLRWKKIAASK